MNKLTLLTKPTQSGKTFCVLNYIGDQQDEHTVNILFVDNSLLQSTQLKTRIEEFDNIDVGSTLVLSSKSKCKTSIELPGQILGKGIRNIILCSNATRAKDIDVFLNQWSLFDQANAYKFNILIDECDRMLGLFAAYIEKWTALNHIQNIMLITATPHKIIQEYREIYIMKMQNTYDANIYHRFSDSQFVIYELDKNDNRNYYEKCLNMALENEHINAGNVFYFPGQTKKISHYAIKNICLDYGFNVVVINADGCRLYTDAADNKNFITIKTTGKRSLNDIG